MSSKPLAVCLFALYLIVVVVTASTAQAHLAYHPRCSSLDCRAQAQERNLAHARYVCDNGGGRHKRWACRAVRWLGRELGQTRARMEPPLGVWDRIAGCEQGVRYGHHAGWLGFYSSIYEGALGFTHQTWGYFAPRAGVHGVSAASAPRRLQIRVAEYLRDVMGYGYQPWPGCRTKLGLP